VLEAEKKELLHMLAEKEDIIEQLQHDLNNLQMHPMAHTPTKHQQDNVQNRYNRPTSKHSTLPQALKSEKSSIKYDMDEDRQEEMPYEDFLEFDRPWRNRRKEAVRNRNYRRSSNDHQQQDNHDFETHLHGKTKHGQLSKKSAKKIYPPSMTSRI
jgi:hypothetical protein